MTRDNEQQLQHQDGQHERQQDRQHERQLISRACEGDRSAMRRIIDLHKDRLFSFIWRIVRNHHDAEEVCQEAFLKAFSSLHTFLPEYRFSTWLFTIAYRVGLNRMRRRKSSTEPQDITLFPIVGSDHSVEIAESEDAARLRSIVWDAVAQLSEPQQAALLLFYRHDLGCPEIARVLEVPVATVKSHLHRGRARLRELLEEQSDAALHEFRNRSAFAG